MKIKNWKDKITMKDVEIYYKGRFEIMKGTTTDEMMHLLSYI